MDDSSRREAPEENFLSTFSVENPVAAGINNKELSYDKKRDFFKRKDETFLDPRSFEIFFHYTLWNSRWISCYANNETD